MGEIAFFIVSIGMIHILGAMSPGPDFFLVTRNSLVYSRVAGVYTAIGLAVGISLHFSLYVLGAATLLQQSPLAFMLFRGAGACYLGYLGFTLICKPLVISAAGAEISAGGVAELRPQDAFKMGFLTNILNPKVAVYLISLISQVVDTDTPRWLTVTLGAEIVFLTAGWFTVLALVLSQDAVRKRFQAFYPYLEKVMGALLILFSARLVLAPA